MNFERERWAMKKLVSLALGSGLGLGCDWENADGSGEQATVESARESEGEPARRVADVVDDFERPDGPELGRTPVGGFAWHASTEGSGLLSQGTLSPSPEGVELRELVLDDFALQIRVRAEDSAAWSIGYRHTEGLGYRVEVSDGAIALLRAGEKLGVAALEPSMVKWRQVMVVAEGPTHRVEIDGAVVLDVEDPDGPLEGTLALAADPGIAFDDLEVFLGIQSASTGSNADGLGGGGGGLATPTLSGGDDGGGDGGADTAFLPFGSGGGGSASAGDDGGDAGDDGPPEPTDEDIRNGPAESPDLTVPTTLYKMTRHLFDGTSPEQQGADLEVLAPSHIALVHGYVRDAWGQPLEGVDVSAVGHSEFGSTTTRADGGYDLVVAGGHPLAVALVREDYLTAHRHVPSKRGESHRLDDVVLIQSDPEASLILFDDPIEVHHAFTLNDGAPDRMATVMFRQGTQATMVFADESTAPLPEMTVRLTEYTVGPDGPERMPARLPEGTAYNYAVEISADEAEAAGAISVELDTPAVLYVDNFLGWAVGTVVPSGAYDRMEGRWVPEPDGRVIEIVDVNGSGLAEIDIRFDDFENDPDEMDDHDPATPQELAELGITDDERAELASIYDVGAQLWRVEINHFTPYDANPSRRPSVGRPPPGGIRPASNARTDDPALTCGSIIDIDNQDLGEALPIAGTPFRLQYRSSRTRGAPNRGLSVDVTGDNPPDNLLGTVLLVEVAGRWLQVATGPEPNTYAELQWDGLDAWGRPVQGPQPIELCVAWAFPWEGGESQPAPTGSTDASGGPGSGAYGPVFGQSQIAAYRVHAFSSPFGTSDILVKCYGNGKSVAAGQTGTITAAHKFRLGGLDAQSLSDGLGAWTIDAHHTLARATATVYLGDGSEREVADEAMWLALRFAGNRQGTGSVALEGIAQEAQYNGASAIEVDREGNVYVATPGLVRKIAPDGTGEIVAGIANDPDMDGQVPAGTPADIGFSGDEGPATAAQLGNNIPGIAVTSAGGIYIADRQNHRVRYVDPSGIIWTVAGSGSSSQTENAVYNGLFSSGGNPLLASLAGVNDVALTEGEGGLLIAQGGKLRLLELNSQSPEEGELHHVAGRPAPLWLDIEEELPSAPCSVGDDPPDTCECVQCNGTVELSPPFNSIPGFQQSRTEWAAFYQDGPINAAAAEGSVWYLGQRQEVNSSTLRFISEQNIHSFRTEYDTSVLNCPSGSGCSFPTETDLTEQIWSIHADDDGVFFTSLPLGGGPPRLAHAHDDLNSPIETITGGPEATTFMCPGTSCDGTDDAILAADLRLGASKVARGPDGAFYVADARGLVYRITRAVPPMYVSSWLASEDGSEMFLFDDEGRHLETRDARTHDLVWSFEYDEDGLLVRVADRFGNETTITRTNGVATSIVGADGQVTLLGYDANGFLDEVTDPNGATTYFQYDATGRMTSMWDSEEVNAPTDFHYDSRGRLDEDEATITYEAEQAIATQTLTNISSDESVEVTHTSAVGVDTVYRRDTTGPSSNLRTITWPDGTESTRARSPEAVTAESPDGTTVTTEFEVDLRLGANTRVPAQVQVAIPDGPTTTTTFDRSFVPNCATFSDGCVDVGLAGLKPDEVVDIVNIEGEAWTQTFTRAHLDGGNLVPATIVLQTPMTRETSVTLDEDEQVETLAVADLAPVTFSYDLRGRLESITQTDGVDTRSTTITYAHHPTEGFLETVTVTDALARETSYLYDEVGRVQRQTFPDGRFVVFNYDDDGNVTSVTPPSRPAHVFTHDSADRMRTYEPPPAGVPNPVTAYTYNAGHQPDVITRPDGQTLVLAYEPTTGKLDTITIGAVAYDYDYDPSTGQVSTIDDPDGGSLGYDYAGFLVTREELTGDVAGSVSWSYDDHLRLATVSVNDANPTAIEYDDDGVPELVGALDLAIDPVNGALVGTTLGGLTSSHAYNDFGEPLGATYTYNSTTVYDLDLTRDEVGRIKTKTETRGAIATLRCYEYDQAGRLTDVYDAADSMGCTGTLLEHYGYDANGNRNEASNSAGTVTTPEITIDDQDRLLYYGSASMLYTDNGELAWMEDGGETTLTWDAVGNLQAVELPSGTDIEYVYDARDRRVGKRVDDVLVQRFLYGDQLEPVAELDSMGNVVTRFVYGTRSNVPDYMVRGGTTYRIISDHLGSVVAVVNTSSGAVLQEVTYDTWGRVLSDTNPGFQPFGFAGGVRDEHTGWVHFGARDYDPETGRWLSKDPLRFGGGSANLFHYVDDDPVNRIDPSGGVIVFVMGIAGAATAAGAATGAAYLGAAVSAISFAVFVPSEEVHRARNQSNRCPARIEACEGNAEFDANFGKYRFANGSECKYDENGNLVLYDGNTEGGTYNFYNFFYAHFWADWFAHHYHGQGLRGFFSLGPTSWEAGAGGYEQPDPTDVY